MPTDDDLQVNPTDNGFELHVGTPEGCHTKIAKVVKNSKVTIFDYLSINTRLTSSLTPKVVTTRSIVIFGVGSATALDK